MVLIGLSMAIIIITIIFRLDRNQSRRFEHLIVLVRIGYIEQWLLEI